MFWIKILVAGSCVLLALHLIVPELDGAKHLFAYLSLMIAMILVAEASKDAN